MAGFTTTHSTLPVRRYIVRLPTPELHDADAAALVAALTAAAAVARAATGDPPQGVRAVEIADGDTLYLCATADGVVCVDGERPARTRRRVHQAVTASLVWEHLEEAVDVAALEHLCRCGGRVLGVLAEPPAVVDAVGGVIDAAQRLAAWRGDPMRAVASVPQLDQATRLQDRAWRAYGRFVSESDPLVSRQDELEADVVAALRDFEHAAGAAGLAGRLADLLGPAMRACDAAADDLVAQHQTPLDDL